MTDTLLAVDFDNDGIVDIGIFNQLFADVFVSQVELGTEFMSPPGEFSTLVENVDGSFTRTLKNGTRIEFNALGQHIEGNPIR